MGDGVFALVVIASRAFTFGHAFLVRAAPVRKVSALAAANLLFMLSVFTLPAAAADTAPAAPDCRLKLYTSVDLEVADEVYVPVSIDGHNGLMSLNLGSAVGLLSKEAVADMGLAIGAAPWRFLVGDKRISRIGKFKSLVIGSLRFGLGGELMIDPNDTTTRTLGSRPIFGSLGMAVFSVVDFELDLAHRKLNLFSQDHCPGNVVYWADSYAKAPLYSDALRNVYLPIELEGKMVEATLSPSRPTTRLYVDVTRRLYGFDKKSRGVELGADSDGSQTAHYRAMRFTAPGFAVTNSNILLEDPVKDCQLSRGRKSGAASYSDSCLNVYPMALGRNVLEQLRLYFATKEKVLYFTGANETSSTAGAVPAAAPGAEP